MAMSISNTVFKMAGQHGGFHKVAPASMLFSFFLSSVISKSELQQLDFWHSPWLILYLQVGHGEQRQQGEGHQVEQSGLCSTMDPGGHGGSQQSWGNINNMSEMSQILKTKHFERSQLKKKKIHHCLTLRQYNLDLLHPSLHWLLTYKVSDESAVEIGDALHASRHVTGPWDFPSRLLLVVIITQDKA